jgi:threonine dehydratase
VAALEPISLDDVERARAAIGDRLHRTPTFSSATLGERTGAAVHLKAELFQRTGSFKPRGVLAKLDALTPEERARGIIGASAGNLAQALAYCAALAGVDCLVVMWKGASEAKIAATRGYGATVDLEADGAATVLERLAELEQETGRVLVRPWDDPLLMAGHGTVGLELVDDVPDVDVVVCPVGGGGLISGLATAVKGRKPQARVVGVEPELAPALRAALDAGHPVRIDPKSIADGLNAPQAGAGCLPICRERVDDLVLLSEADIREGMRFLYTRAKLACEPAGAVATAALLAGKIPLEPGETAVAVVSGGNVSPEIASGILAPDEG